ncbi:DUF1858 domain-containing protein [Enterococcus xiangfangensis]|uniref:DUF1858 domain-containing protein n=1 Tax=Enterococcus xiangfangensis TaxID=1296537 RepID=UPI0010F69F8C|nr:DUF1858 domain-containing protein [Enterococcus xiangfangensis]MBM7711993.1 hypothetical protein [Enterococcus xiangfangensis]NBK08043.1 DUF1858 domain-containing protein [Enterococcus asini]
MKELDLSKSLFELVTLYPEVKDLMYKLGFDAIAKPGMLQTAGRYVTIPKGAKMKHIPMEQIIETFEANGFTVKGVV